MLFVLKVHETICLSEYYALVKEYSLQRSISNFSQIGQIILMSEAILYTAYIHCLYFMLKICWATRNPEFPQTRLDPT